MKITILTTSIHQKISGGTIYNSKLHEFLSANFEVSLEMIDDCNSFSFDENCHYIIDGILINEDLIIKKLTGFSVCFLIHLWPSITQVKVEKKKTLEKIEKDICKNFKLLLTGENSKNHIQEKLKTTAENFIFSPGIDAKWKQKTAFPILPTKFIYLSNFIEGKGHFRLIEVVSLIQNTTIEIDCFGEILSEHYFNDFLKNKPININYKEKIAHSEINELLLNYDGLIHLSDYESFGMGISEAIATNLPLIITPVGNFENYKKNNLKGVLNTFESKEIANYIEQICSDKEKYNELINSVSDYKITTWEENFKPILELFTTK